MISHCGRPLLAVILMEWWETLLFAYSCLRQLSNSSSFNARLFVQSYEIWGYLISFVWFLIVGAFLALLIWLLSSLCR